MTEEQHIASLTFWMGAEAAREYAAWKTKEKLDEERIASLITVETDDGE